MEGKELQIIDERELLGKHFVMYGTKEEPLFRATDVAEWIGYDNGAKMVRNVDDDEKVKIILPYHVVDRQNSQMVDHRGILCTICTQQRVFPKWK